MTVSMKLLTEKIACLSHVCHMHCYNSTCDGHQLFIHTCLNSQVDGVIDTKFARHHPFLVPRQKEMSNKNQPVSLSKADLIPLVNGKNSEVWAFSLIQRFQ